MDQEAIRNQIDRILSSATFADKDQLRRLLQFLSDHIDSQRILKPDRIIRELWPDKNGSKGSADLAAEIYRARQALESYYHSEGENDPIIIRLPKRAPATNGNKDRQWMMAELRAVAESALVPEPPRAPEGPVALVSTIIPEPPIAALVSALKPAQLTFFRTRTGRVSLVAGILFAILAICITVRMLVTDNTPHAARLDGGTLTILNSKGDELWRKSFPDGLWAQYYSPGLAWRIWFGDLDGRGKTSVLFLYHPALNATGRSTTLICYSASGTEKWRWTPGRALPELGNEPAVFVSFGLGVLQTGGGRPARIVISSVHWPFFPTQIALVDRHGKTISEYWHSGWLFSIALADLEGDGRQEIIATGVDNGYRQATLVVLDPDKLSGASSEAVRPEIQIHGMGIAHERLRLLFPRTDLNMAEDNYNQGHDIAVGNGSVRVSVWECRLNADCVILYEFDRTFTLRGVYASDTFRDAHKQYYRNTKDDHPFTDQEQQELEKITCLEGCKTEFLPVNLQ